MRSVFLYGVILCYFEGGNVTSVSCSTNDMKTFHQLGFLLHVKNL